MAYPVTLCPILDMFHVMILYVFQEPTQIKTMFFLSEKKTSQIQSFKILKNHYYASLSNRSIPDLAINFSKYVPFQISIRLNHNGI